MYTLKEEGFEYIYSYRGGHTLYFWKLHFFQEPSNHQKTAWADPVTKWQFVQKLQCFRTSLQCSGGKTFFCYFPEAPSSILICHPVEKVTSMFSLKESKSSFDAGGRTEECAPFSTRERMHEYEHEGDGRQDHWKRHWCCCFPTQRKGVYASSFLLSSNIRESIEELLLHL